MVDRLLTASIEHRWLVVILSAAFVAAGIHATLELPIDAVPDVTTNQVQVNALAPAFAPEEMERYVTFPIELALASVPNKEAIRSTSKFGLSAVTITFADDVDIYWARQVVAQALAEAQEELPTGVVPEMSPVSTGLGEVYQFVVEADPGYEEQYPLVELRTILDWQIIPRLRSVPGVIEVNSFGGTVLQYEVAVDPDRLVAYGVTIHDVVAALQSNNANEGGAYLERAGEQQIIRGVGLLESAEDISRVVVRAGGETSPVFIRDIGTVVQGAAVRQGACTKDGRGEAVMAIAMMLKGENSRRVSEAVDARIGEIRESLPEGVRITTYHNRSELVERTVHTAAENLIVGGAIVVGVLLLFLLQLRAGLVVSAAIPLAMLAALIGMSRLGISANLMSLGAIDFGLVVDGAVVMVENCVRRLAERRAAKGRGLTEGERLDTVTRACLEMRKAGQFGLLIIMAAYLPILVLGGMEGKMFRPMGLTVTLALLGALILNVTVIPALCALVLRDVPERRNALMERLSRLYAPLIEGAMARRRRTLAAGSLLTLAILALFPVLGSEFLPELDEGGIAINLRYTPSISLAQSVENTLLVERAVRESPEVEIAVSRIGRPEIATDPMGVDHVDVYAFLKPRSEWTTARTHDELVEGIAKRIEEIPGVVASFSQPIQFRMMELIEGAGSRSDVVVKVAGEDMETLRETAAAIGAVLQEVPGAADLKVQQTAGLPMLNVEIDRAAIARHGISVDDVNEVVRTAIAGTNAGNVLQGFRRFGLVVRLAPEARRDAADLARLLVAAPGGATIPLGQLARITSSVGPSEIGRENGERVVTVQCNVRGRDIGGFVADARQRVHERVDAPSGYAIEWGGMWKHLESGRNRLMVAVPVAFAAILVLLFTSFGSVKHALLVFSAVPFAVTGGIVALLLRGMPFSMSAGVGFIAVSGVAVLNGVVLVTFILAELRAGRPLVEAVRETALTRLRPVLMTAAVASVGFLPMALSHGSGAEVQRPLATVVIGGLLTSTVLTLVVLPALLTWVGSLGARGEQATDA